MFTKPDRPFLLLYEDLDNNIVYAWCESEKEITDIMTEIVEEGCYIIDAIEIGSCREIHKPTKYTADNFYTEIFSIYDSDMFNPDTMVITIDTDFDKMYCIEETVDGFKCGEFEFDDLDTLIYELYDSEIKDKPKSIKMEQKLSDKNICVSCGTELDGNLKLCDKCASEIKF